MCVFAQPGEKGSPEGERETERERNHVSFARHLHTHHHTHLGMSYNLMSGQYDIYQGTTSWAQNVSNWKWAAQPLFLTLSFDWCSSFESVLKFQGSEYGQPLYQSAYIFNRIYLNSVSPSSYSSSATVSWTVSLSVYLEHYRTFFPLKCDVSQLLFSLCWRVELQVAGLQSAGVRTLLYW